MKQTAYVCTMQVTTFKSGGSRNTSKYISLRPGPTEEDSYSTGPSTAPGRLVVDQIVQIMCRCRDNSHDQLVEVASRYPGGPSRVFHLSIAWHTMQSVGLSTDDWLGQLSLPHADPQALIIQMPGHALALVYSGGPPILPMRPTYSFLIRSSICRSLRQQAQALHKSRSS